MTHTSVTGERFTANALEQVDLAGRPAYRISITGTGYAMADGNVYVNERDPLSHGFVIG